ncbi:hypothetical protein [Hylemonella gracilis]|uniref:hypothetical protein n=1 Tax=Hylemonella gracilis TaxID=80880 RepID=UPI001040DFA3|nr:hypothetical protein [Hylemonella gracilis]
MRKPILKSLRQGALLAGAWLLASGAQAAGGHHAVDDAAILDSRSCVADAWVGDSRTTLLHLGASCGVGPVELGVSTEHERSFNSDSDFPSQTGLGLEVKWAHELDQEVGLGLSYEFGLDARPFPPEYALSSFNGLFTWTPSWSSRREYAVHLNLGTDIVDGGDAGGNEDYSRWGVALEWTPDGARLPDMMKDMGQWSFVGERFRRFDADYLRLGFRIGVGRNGNIDISREQGLNSTDEGGRWFFGVTMPLEIR